MEKVLVICGPTATGKTKLALHLAERFNGEIISADSRQVYRHMNVVTGKDIPTGFTYDDDDFGSYSNGKVRIWGYDLVAPNEDFSVSHYSNIARKILADIPQRGKLPIIEGGTGLYIDALLGSMDKIDIPPNKRLREKYSDLSAKELYGILLNINPAKAIRLNESDSKNPRRLIRLLEIEDYELSTNREVRIKKNTKYDSLWIGLKYQTRETLYQKVEERVEKRMGKSLEAEIKFLKRNNYFSQVALNTPGYKYWDNPEKWKAQERKYAKRQLTWFTKKSQINWFNAKNPELKAEVEERVSKWYHENNI